MTRNSESDARAALAEHMKWWDQQLRNQQDNQKVESPLYHYTDVNGFLGIIKNEEIWFTSMFHLNDPSELEYGLTLAIETIEEAASNRDELAKLFCKSLVEELKGLTKDFLGHYIACFSKASNDLGQWRAYGDNGRGVAIGLAPHLFHPKEETTHKPNEVTYVADVNYDRDAARRRILEPAERILDIVSRAREFGEFENTSPFLSDCRAALEVSISWYALQTKHEAYNNERETRLMIQNEKTMLRDYIETRVRGASIVPFIRSPFPVKAGEGVTEIVIGPSAAVGTEDAIQTFLLSQGLFPAVSVRRSNIPYRAH